jgi:Cu2+-exporting ATPase
MSALEAVPAEALDPEPYVGQEDGLSTLHLMVDVHCGACVQRIERALLADPAVERARVNLTTRRLVVSWRGPAQVASRLAGKVAALGYRAVPYDPEKLARADIAVEKQLLVALAVAGFAAGNVMLFSISVWAGQFQGMGAATRGLLHGFSALVALPAIAFAGQPFFGSAFEALRHGRTNMDVPISRAILLAAAMSLSETIQGGAHVYFDSAIMLLFFLLVGRYLDRRARGVARRAAERLLALDSGSLTVLDADGSARTLPHAGVRAGMTLHAAAGERIGLFTLVVVNYG